MNIKNFFIFCGIITLIYGILLILVPTYMYDVNTDLELGEKQFLNLAASGYATLLLGISCSFFTALKARASYARRSLILGISVTATLATVLYGWAVFAGPNNLLGLGPVIINTVVAIWGWALYGREQELMDAD